MLEKLTRILSTQGENKMEKIILLLVPLLFGCGKIDYPDFPTSVQYHYLIQVKNEPPPIQVFQAIENYRDIEPMLDENAVARCLEFKIISHVPYKIKFIGEQPLKSCNGVGGYRPNDFETILSWSENIRLWAEEKVKEKCFR